MSNIPSIRDWTYVALIAALLVAYAAGLVSQAAEAGESKEPPHICLFHEMASGTQAR